MSGECENCRKLEDQLLRLSIESTQIKIPTWEELKSMVKLRVLQDEHNEFVNVYKEINER